MHTDRLLRLLSHERWYYAAFDNVYYGCQGKSWGMSPAGWCQTTGAGRAAPPAPAMTSPAQASTWISRKPSWAAWHGLEAWWWIQQVLRDWSVCAVAQARHKTRFDTTSLRLFAQILSRNKVSELRALVWSQALQLANASARTRRRRHISCAFALHSAHWHGKYTNLKAVMSEGGGEGNLLVKM